jgi:phosphoribosylformimino-5-aminoimidazole carboxamide ribotide isomerase
LALDVRNIFLSVKGWSKETRINVFDFLKKIKDLKLNSIIFTDINRDGTKKGVNLIQLKKIIKTTNFPVVASGGVASLKDINKLSFVKRLSGVIIGRSIYDGSINLNKLLKLSKN